MREGHEGVVVGIQPTSDRYLLYNGPARGVAVVVCRGAARAILAVARAMKKNGWLLHATTTPRTAPDSEGGKPKIRPLDKMMQTDRQSTAGGQNAPLLSCSESVRSSLNCTFQTLAIIDQRLIYKVDGRSSLGSMFRFVAV